MRVVEIIFNGTNTTATFPILFSIELSLIEILIKIQFLLMIRFVRLILKALSCYQGFSTDNFVQNLSHVEIVFFSSHTALHDKFFLTILYLKYFCWFFQHCLASPFKFP